MAKNPKKDAKDSSGTIALNKKARHDYFIEDTYEAGMSLEGWEVKSIRAGRVQLSDSYVLIKNAEAYLFGALITPLPTVSTHFVPDPTRTRKLLLNRREISHLIGAAERQGYTIVPLAMYWKHNRVKLEIGLAKGKQKHDKRESERERDWQREKGRILKHG